MFPSIGSTPRHFSSSTGSSPLSPIQIALPLRLSFPQARAASITARSTITISERTIADSKKFFPQHGDEYIGQPRLQSDILSVLFPLRNDRNQILATVKLRSPSRTAFLLAQKEKFLLVVYLFLTASAILLFLMFFRRSSFAERLKIWPALASLGVIVLVRGLLFLPSGLESLKVLPLFSPTIAGFFSWGRLTRSPGRYFHHRLLPFRPLRRIGLLCQKNSRAAKAAKRGRRPGRRLGSLGGRAFRHPDSLRAPCSPTRALTCSRFELGRPISSSPSQHRLVRLKRHRCDLHPLEEHLRIPGVPVARHRHLLRDRNRGLRRGRGRNFPARFSFTA